MINRARSPIGAVCVIVASSWIAACGSDGSPAGPDGTTDPIPAPVLQFDPPAVSLGEERAETIRIRNTGTVAAGPVDLVAGPVRTSGGNSIPGASMAVSPSEVATLNPGDSRDLTLSVDIPDGLSGGEYEVSLDARVGGTTLVSLGLVFSVVPQGGPLVGSVSISGDASGAAQGDVVPFSVDVRDPDGNPVSNPTVSWRTIPSAAGLVTGDGRLVSYVTGSLQLVAEAQGAADTLEVSFAARQVPAGGFKVLGNGTAASRYFSDHWEHGTTAYSGTWGCRDVPGGACGDALLVWDISGGADPVLVDSVIVDARVVNDIKVSADGRRAILTHEHSDDLQNGITLLDLADPRRPQVIGRFAAPDLSPGVHNVWIEGDFAYLVVDGSAATSGLRILDISDPSVPRIVSSFYGGSSFLHDVYVRDGLAFLSHWDAGLIILDVGNGIRGGSPTSPREVSRIDMPGYLVHNAWYWPSGGFVFLGDEIGIPGRVKIIDVHDLANPIEVGSIARSDAAPHNFWIDEDRGIGYFAWYEAGVQAFDLTGQLLGSLERQGRFIAESGYAAGGACLTTEQQCAWAPQLHEGRIYVSDMNTGLWVLAPQF